MKMFSVFLLLAMIVSTSKAQTSVKEQNHITFDSIISELTRVCSGLAPMKSLEQRQIKYDENTISFLNVFFSRDLPIDSIGLEYKRRFRHRWICDTIRMGEVVKYVCRIPNRGNLNLTFSFSTYEGRIVYKHLEFSTNSKTKCQPSFGYFPFSQDFVYINTLLIPQIDFKLTAWWSCPVVSSDTIYREKLKEYSVQRPIVMLPDSLRFIESLMWHEFDTYKVDYVESKFYDIVKMGNLDILIGLLDSPNRILSIYAMEAIEYLRYKGKVKLTPEIENKLWLVASDDTKIKWQTSDVVRSGRPYKDLRIYKSSVMVKYSKLPPSKFFLIED